jgi:hypothetical protein
MPQRAMDNRKQIYKVTIKNMKGRKRKERRKKRIRKYEFQRERRKRRDSDGKERHGRGIETY